MHLKMKTFSDFEGFEYFEYSFKLPKDKTNIQFLVYTFSQVRHAICQKFYTSEILEIFNFTQKNA